MKAIMVIVLLSTAWTATVASAACSAVCDPEVSKPCGLVCISKFKNCHKPTTSACMGKAGRSTKKVYKEPKKVEPEEQMKRTEGVVYGRGQDDNEGAQ